MDQAESQNQKFSRNFRKCGHDSNLDRSDPLPAGGLRKIHLPNRYFADRNHGSNSRWYYDELRSDGDSAMGQKNIFQTSRLESTSATGFIRGFYMKIFYRTAVKPLCNIPQELLFSTIHCKRKTVFDSINAHKTALPKSV